MNNFDDNSKVKTNLAIDCGSDDTRSVGSFKVSTHDLVKFPIAQTLENVDLSNVGFEFETHHALQLQTFCPKEVDCLLVFV